jgi:hypothetical protein
MHLDNLLFILLIAMAALFRLLASKAGETKKRLQNPDQRSTTSPQLGESSRRARVESDEARVRRFLEALGQPPTSRPPPPVVPRTDISPRPLAPVRPPIGPVSPAPWQVTREERRKRRYILPETPHVAPPVFEVHEVAPHRTETVTSAAAQPIASQAPPSPARSETSAISLLRSPSGLRSAIIVREIFGPPRSLQPFDLIGSA